MSIFILTFSELLKIWISTLRRPLKKYVSPLGLYLNYNFLRKDVFSTGLFFCSQGHHDWNLIYLKKWRLGVPLSCVKPFLFQTFLQNLFEKWRLGVPLSWVKPFFFKHFSKFYICVNLSMSRKRYFSPKRYVTCFSPKEIPTYPI